MTEVLVLCRVVDEWVMFQRFGNFMDIVFQRDTLLDIELAIMSQRITGYLARFASIDKAIDCDWLVALRNGSRGSLASLVQGMSLLHVT